MSVVGPLDNAFKGSCTFEHGAPLLAVQCAAAFWGSQSVRAEQPPAPPGHGHGCQDREALPTAAAPLPPAHGLLLRLPLCRRRPRHECLCDALWLLRHREHVVWPLAHQVRLEAWLPGCWHRPAPAGPALCMCLTAGMEAIGVWAAGSQPLPPMHQPWQTCARQRPSPVAVPVSLRCRPNPPAACRGCRETQELLFLPAERRPGGGQQQRRPQDADVSREVTWRCRPTVGALRSAGVCASVKVYGQCIQ